MAIVVPSPITWDSTKPLPPGITVTPQDPSQPSSFFAQALSLTSFYISIKNIASVSIDVPTALKTVGLDPSQLVSMIRPTKYDLVLSGSGSIQVSVTLPPSLISLVRGVISDNLRIPFTISGNTITFTITLSTRVVSILFSPITAAEITVDINQLLNQILTLLVVIVILMMIRDLVKVKR